MIKEPTKPDWYNDEYYNKPRTPEEWLDEIEKRYSFKQDKIGLPEPFSSLPQSKQEVYFLNYIFRNNMDSILHELQPTKRNPIKYPSVSDIFIMYHLLINSDWYKNHPKRITFENAITKHLNNEFKTRKQKNVLNEMYDTPWCVFNKNYTNENWSPIRDFHYLTGIPLSLDPFHLKKTINSDLNNKLTKWSGKPHDFLSRLETWHESKILAVFDLQAWFKIQKLNCTNKSIYDLIWPHGRRSKTTGEEVEPNAAIKNSINLTDEVISPGYIKLLIMICEDRKFTRQTRDTNLSNSLPE